MIDLEKIHTTKLGELRIRRNLELDDGDDVVSYIRELINNKKTISYKKGKNIYFEIDEIIITINAKSYTIITAHLLK